MSTEAHRGRHRPRRAEPIPTTIEAELAQLDEWLYGAPDVEPGRTHRRRQQVWRSFRRAHHTATNETARRKFAAEVLSYECPGCRGRFKRTRTDQRVCGDTCYERIRPVRDRGFLLLEIVLALSVGSLLMLALATGWVRLARASDVLEQRLADQAEVVATTSRLEHRGPISNCSNEAAAELVPEVDAGTTVVAIELLGDPGLQVCLVEVTAGTAHGTTAVEVTP